MQERDAGTEGQTPVLSGDTLGSFEGTNDDQCCIDGIVDFQTTLFSSTAWPVPPDCLRRSFNDVGFTSEMIALGIIRGVVEYASFRPVWEAGPHGSPHNFVGGHMFMLYSPDDPLFHMHHSNVDRWWSLHQDFLGHDTLAVAVDSYTIPEHYAGPPDEAVGLDEVLGFNCRYEDGDRPCDLIDFTIDGTNFPRPWQLMSNDSIYMRVTYVNDFLARQLVAAEDGNSAWNNPRWIEIATDDVDVRCNRDGNLPGEMVSMSPTVTSVPSNMPTPKLPIGCPKIPFTQLFPAMRLPGLCQEMIDQGEDPKEDDFVLKLLLALAEEDCEQRGNPPTATEEWINMTGIPPERAECFVPQDVLI